MNGEVEFVVEGDAEVFIRRNLSKKEGGELERRNSRTTPSTREEDDIGFGCQQGQAPKETKTLR